MGMTVLACCWSNWRHGKNLKAGMYKMCRHNLHLHKLMAIVVEVDSKPKSSTQQEFTTNKKSLNDPYLLPCVQTERDFQEQMHEMHVSMRSDDLHGDIPPVMYPVLDCTQDGR